jgi:hypothetical protein
MVHGAADNSIDRVRRPAAGPAPAQPRPPPRAPGGGAGETTAMTRGIAASMRAFQAQREAILAAPPRTRRTRGSGASSSGPSA